MFAQCESFHPPPISSLAAKTDGSLWSIDRASFQYLMMKMGVEQQQEHEVRLCSGA